MERDVKHMARQIPRMARLALIVGGMLATFMLALSLVYAIPHEPVRRHVAQSIATLEREGAGYEPFYGVDKSRLDNFSDAVMLNAAVGFREQSPFQRGLDIQMASVTGDMVFQYNVIDSAALAATPAGEWADQGYEYPDLASSPATTTNTFSYARYWHGYQIVLRPALALFTYPAIRYINSILWLVATLCLAALIRRKLGGRIAGAFLFSFLPFSPMTIPISISFAGDFYLAYALSVAVLLWGGRPDWHRRDIELFFVVGMLTSFVDLLIVPLLSLGIPLALLMLLQARNMGVYNWKHGLEQVARVCLAWGAGYTVSWSAKWIIGSVALGRNMLLEALVASYHRANGPVLGRGFHDFGALGSNLAMLVPDFGVESALPGPQPEVILAYAVGLLLLIAAATIPLTRFRRRPRDWSSLVPLAVVGALPYAWYVMIASHSERHYWFTYRIQFISVFVMAAVYVSLLDWEAVRGAGRFVRWKLTQRR